MADDKEQTWDEFREAVNMQPQELEDWLETEKSKSVGDSDSGESTGHKMGKRIVEIKRTNKDDLTDSDYDDMSKVVGYVHRHKAGPRRRCRGQRLALQPHELGPRPLQGRLIRRLY